MPSPFPGMDPYLESPTYWAGLHHRLITYCCTVLDTALPPNYVADLAERLYVVQPQRRIYPDVFVLDHPAPPVARPAGAAERRWR